MKSLIRSRQTYFSSSCFRLSHMKHSLNNLKSCHLNSFVFVLLFSLVDGIERNTISGPLPPAVDITPLPKLPSVSMPHLNWKDLVRIVDTAALVVEEQFKQTGKPQTRGSAAWFAAASAQTKSVAKNISKIALIAEEVSRQVASSFSLDKHQVSLALPRVDVRGTLLSDICPVEVDFPCQPRKYRAFSGYCNNVQNPKWGNANTRYLRFLPPDYGDGVSSLRIASDSSLLPSPREISIVVHKQNREEKHNHVTAMITAWGQFIWHDLAHTSQAIGNGGQRLKCCGNDVSEQHPECSPISVPVDDPFYKGINCLEYVRSCMGLRTGCKLGPREQVNQVTSFLDGSVIYGSSKEEADKLRQFHFGLLRTQNYGGKKGILMMADSVDDCKSNKFRCFKAGDVRVNENAGIAVMQTLWMREHNRIATGLHKINTHWNDETLYQEARRIVIAELQHIHYKEFLPLILGQQLMEQYGLSLQPSGFYHNYNINMNAGISNTIATSVFPFLLSLFPSTYLLVDPQTNAQNERFLNATFYSPFDLYDARRLDEYTFGLLLHSSGKPDEAVTDQLQNYLFSNSSGIGLDAVAEAIQQGRDHGIPSYTKWREFCGLPSISTFEDLSQIMDPQTITALRQIYKSVVDVDLVTGGMAEISSPGALVGPTFGCLLARQFHYLRRADRFWYETDIPPSAFTKDQLAEIRKVSLSRIICDNSNNIAFIQPEALVKVDPFLNNQMECRSNMIRSMNLHIWKSESSYVIPENLLLESMETAKREVAQRKTNEHQQFLSNVGVASEKSPIGTHSGLVRPKREAISISNTSLILQFASQRFVNSFLQGQLKDVESNLQASKGVEDLMRILPNIDVSEYVDIPISYECDEQVLPCDYTAKFRTATGWCNNLNNPTFGKSFKAFQRLQPPTYNDNLSEPRKYSVKGGDLPSARLVSFSVHSNSSYPHVRYSLMMMQFGQFIDHDLSHTPVNTGFEGAILDCSRCDSRNKVHPECYPIPIPQSDPFFPSVDSKGVKKCISLVRSLPGQLTMGPRQQINQVTAFVDSSHVYGSDVCDSRKLRALVGGRLNVTRHQAGLKDLLPQTTSIKECKAHSGLCFEAGDKRSSEQPGLAVMHTLFLREHNRIVDKLARINPHWTDEELYQNGRRILSAINQHIIYSEFLPRVLGWQHIHKYQLEVLSEGYDDSYDSSCNPTIFNEFASAAFRFGHSLIKPFLLRLDHFFNRSPEGLRLRHKFFNPDDLYRVGMIDEILRGLATAAMETLDQFITSEVTNHLFEDTTTPFSGLDLVAINLQRGREHGIATYNQMRAFCNLTKAYSFQDLTKETAPDAIRKLSSIYNHVDDIDLFTGGLAETPLDGGLIGPTLGCIIAMQFKALKKCDRFWYETSNPLLRFTEAQLMEIRKSTLAKLACENSDSVDTIQRSIFDLPDPFMNPRVPCRSIPEIDFRFWKESSTCSMGSYEVASGASQRISPCVMCICTKEGAICQSMKITNCFALADRYSATDILKDDMCTVQCAFMFRASPQVSQEVSDNFLTIS